MNKKKQIAMTNWIKSMSVGIGGLSGLAQRIGMCEATIFARCRQPEKWRLDELSAIRFACGVNKDEYIKKLSEFI